MERINGYIVAPFTPFKNDGSLNLDVIESYSDFLGRNGLNGVFINGSSGEGALLTMEERKAVAEKWVEVAPKDFKVIVHVGGACLKELKELAAHAQKIGAFGIGSMAPIWMKPSSVEELGVFLKELAGAAPELPFFYYHIPALSGVNLPVTEVLKYASKEIPTFTGVKYTYDNLYEFRQCMLFEEGRYEMLHGLDETFLAGMAFGATGGVGGTYNHCFGVYKGIKEAWEKGDMERARELQDQSQAFINVLVKYRGNIMGGKRMLKFMGIDCGPNRLPAKTISPEEEKAMKADLEAIGFFSFCNK